MIKSEERYIVDGKGKYALNFLYEIEQSGILSRATSYLDSVFLNILRISSR